MKYKILLVEDDDTIREVVSENLKEAGFIVMTVASGQNALEIIQNTKDIDLYIFDIMLPDISGLELLKIVRLAGETPVMMLTAFDDENTQITSFDYLADDYVTKPFSLQILVKRVQALLRRVGKSKSIIKIGKLELNTESYEFFEDGNKVELTFKEFELMQTLMTNCGIVLSRQQLLNLIWKYDYLGDERIINVHIKNIRKKLKNDPIITILGVGYKIEKGERDEET